MRAVFVIGNAVRAFNTALPVTSLLSRAPFEQVTRHSTPMKPT